MFFGILYLSGYNSLARERLYWSLDEDAGVKCVSSCMSRNRLHGIKKYLHFAYNSSIDQSDRMYKLRHLMILLNSKFRQLGIFHDNLSIDEAWRSNLASIPENKLYVEAHKVWLQELDA